MRHSSMDLNGGARAAGGVKDRAAPRPPGMRSLGKSSRTGPLLAFAYHSVENAAGDLDPVWSLQLYRRVERAADVGDEDHPCPVARAIFAVVAQQLGADQLRVAVLARRSNSFWRGPYNSAAQSAPTWLCADHHRPLRIAPQAKRLRLTGLCRCRRRERQGCEWGCCPKGQAPERHRAALLTSDLRCRERKMSYQ